MRRNTSSPGSTDSSTIALAVGESRSRGALVGSLLLLAASFALLVLAPVLLGRFQAAAQGMPTAGFLPIAAASGIALGGGAAMIAVVARLVRDIELRPYAGLAPVLAVFAGFVLWGLRAELPLRGVPSEYAGVFALIVSVAGGALVARPGALSRVVGWAIAFFAPVTLLLMVWGSSGKGNLSDAIVSLTPQLKMFLGLSAGSAFAMVVLGEASRVLARNVRAVELSPKVTNDFAPAREEPLFSAPSLRRPASAVASATYEPPPAVQNHYAAAPSMNTDYELYAADPAAPRVNVWDLDDDNLTLPKRFAWWKVLFLSLLLLGGTGAAVYYGMILPNRAKEQAAAQLLQQKRAQIAADSQREADAKSAIETKAAAARLEAMLTAPAATAAQAEGEAAAAPEEAAVVAPSAVAEPAGKAAVSVEQLKPEAKRAARAKPAPSAEPARSPARSSNASASDDPIYGL